jgi:hypothetical protein
MLSSFGNRRKKGLNGGLRGLNGGAVESTYAFVGTMAGGRRRAAHPLPKKDRNAKGRTPRSKEVATRPRELPIRRS